MSLTGHDHEMFVKTIHEVRGACKQTQAGGIKASPPDGRRSNGIISL